MHKLERMSPGIWWGFTKGDGWRRPCYFDERGWTYYAKRGEGEEARKSPPDVLRKQFESMKWPRGMALDLEWMGPRLREYFPSEHNHEFWIFDILYHDWKWQGKVGFADRWELLNEVYDDACGGKPEDFPRIRLLTPAKENLVEAFEEEKGNPLSEGLVLRHVEGHLIGNLDKAQKNPVAMKKVKYRSIKEKAAF
jgi:hypothetical protein